MKQTNLDLSKLTESAAGLEDLKPAASGRYLIRVRTGRGNLEKSWNSEIKIPGLEKSWNLKYCLKSWKGYGI